MLKKIYCLRCSFVAAVLSVSTNAADGTDTVMVLPFENASDKA